MIFSENRLPRRIESGAGFWQDHALAGNALAGAALIPTRRGRPIWQKIINTGVKRCILLVTASWHGGRPRR
jgi:hypothetical protein